MGSSNIPTEECYTSLPVTKFRGGVNLYQWKGFWLRLEYLEAVKEVLSQFKPLPSDIIFASFPKTGTTWLKALLFSITNRSSRNLVRSKHPHSLVPTLEIQLYGSQAEEHNSFPSLDSSTRVFATHLPYQILENTLTSSDCRVVYVTRNPKDTLVSFWHFVQKIRTHDGDWPLEDGVENFCHGEVPFGPYFEHVLGYQKASLEKPKKVFFITYEELKDDCRNHVKKLGEFLGCPFDEETEGEVVLDEILENCSLEKLRNYEINKSGEEDVTWLKLPRSSFYRQGRVGDHKSLLSEEIIGRIDRITEEKFYASGFMYGI